MITLPRPTREVVPRPTREVVRRHPWVAHRPTGSPRLWRRCCRCRRCRQALGGTPGCGCPETTMCGQTATTTRCIPQRWGRRVLVRADLDRICVWCEGSVVADHVRVWARHQTITDPLHVKAAQTLRQQRFALVSPTTETEVEQRCLADYDSALEVAEFDGRVAW